MMTGLIKGGLSAVTGFFGGIQTYLITGAIALAVGSASGAWVGYRIESGKVAAIQASLAEAETQVAQRSARIVAVQDRVALDAALSNQKIIANISLQTAVNAKEITIYVHDKISCPGPTVGLARVLRAYSEGIDPASLSLTPGQSDDDCSDVTPSEMAGWFNAFADVARKNAQQLNDLEAEIRASHNAEENTK